MKNSLFDRIKAFFSLRFRRGERINIEYPVSWETMSRDDFRNVCTVLSDRHGRKETLFLCLCALAHIRPDNPVKYDPRALKDNVAFIIGGRSYIISPKVITEACTQLGFIYDSVGLAPCPLFGVDRKLYGIPFLAFYKADSYIMAYSADRNPGFLKEAAKALTNGAVRKLFPWQQEGLVIWWNGVKMYLKTKYPFVFRDGEDGEGFSDKTQEEILQDLLSCMNDDKPQNNEDILKSDTHQVLFCLNKIYERNAERRVS